ncbi:component of SufBCD complex [Brevirhabdus pacifica]|uniref:Component of SufBCD complex n=1 Tax=Brevirhabdus pacifica TaxID=1267768 RepID=A0A1U7DF44_9RHOB|nr:component of SufBCD complex [Brevirhabdus pacifica]APX88592.1 component of SufBCD complex [Brevirhabdus pacifica]OWU79876.1 component of SufBCD complex [Loktanella sp. 22II-4b]PJJ86917.1 hypothetical protein CLV77_1478 [Brevirhabdus pacifica]
MDAFATIFELIDMRSFSNLWFWIVLAVIWSTASHWVLGVPYDMVTRAKRQGGRAMDDLNALVGIYVRRLLYIAREAGAVLVGIVFFALTMLAALGFGYGVELCQALFLLFCPLVLVGALSMRTASRIASRDIRDEALFPVLRWHRFWTQVIGMNAIFITSMWGMFQNLRLGPLAG